MTEGMAQSKPIRKTIFTLFVNDTKAPFEEIVRGLLKRVSRDEVKTLQHFGFGRYELNLHSEDAIKRLYENPVVEVSGKEYQLRYMGATTTEVSVFYFPSDEPLENLKERMSQYGQVTTLRPGRYRAKEIDTWETGVIHLKMEIQKEIPNFVQYKNKVLQCEYQGVRRVCRKCCLEGHLSSQCKTPKCKRCGAFGHELCDRPCSRCGQDHPLSQCKKKTFAAALGYLRGLTPDIDTIPVEDPTERAAGSAYTQKNDVEITTAQQAQADRQGDRERLGTPTAENAEGAVLPQTGLEAETPEEKRSDLDPLAIKKLLKDARNAMEVETEIVPRERQETTVIMSQDSLEVENTGKSLANQEEASSIAEEKELVEARYATPPDELRKKVDRILVRGMRTAKTNRIDDKDGNQPETQAPDSTQKKRKRVRRKASPQSVCSSTPVTSATEDSAEEEPSMKESPIEKRLHKCNANLTDTSIETTSTAVGSDASTAVEVSALDQQGPRCTVPRLPLAPDTDVSTGTITSSSSESMKDDRR